jgi:hypothetical protein
MNQRMCQSVLREIELALARGCEHSRVTSGHGNSSTMRECLEKLDANCGNYTDDSGEILCGANARPTAARFEQVAYIFK